MKTQYEYITSGARAEEVAKQLREAKNIAVDTETTGTDPHKDKVTLLSLSSKKNGTFVVDARNPNNLLPFKEVLEDDSIIKTEHNGSFDYQMLLGTCGIETENIICTMLGEHALTKGLQFDGYGLDDVSMKYLGVTKDKTIRQSFIGHTGEFSKEQLDYAADDTADLLDIAQKMQEKAKEMGVLKTWRLESAALQAFADMEFYGQRLDSEKWSGVMQMNREKAEKARQELDGYFEPVCDRMLDGSIVMNYDSQPMLLYKLQQMGITVDGDIIKNTDKKTQKKLREYPVIQALERYRQATKALGTYGQQYLDAVHPVTGRIHFRFNQYGTETGRPACRGGLNCLNIPRELAFRNSFTTDLDRLLGTVDFSGAELRIMADESEDPLMVQGFLSGVDFHCFVASFLFNCEVTKKNANAHLRTPAKTLNFGLAYGMGPGSLYEQLRGMNFPITLQECRDLYSRYKEKFRTTISWLDQQQALAASQFWMANSNGRMRHWIPPNRHKIRHQIVKALAAKKKKVILTDYQVEQIVEDKYRSSISAIKREGANFKIQSVNADMTKDAMAKCRKKFKSLGWGPATAKGARTYNSVYDEIVYDFHKDFAEEGFELQKKIMLESANSMMKKVPMEVEGHLGPVWTK